MTDKKIIKALPQIKYGGCKGCTYGIFSGDDRCGMKGCKIARDALDLIHRQQAEINQFAEANKMVADLKTAETNKTEDEMLKKLLTQRVEFIPNNYDIKTIQRDAVRQFAKKLKEQAFECDISFGLGSQRIRQAVAVDDIDNLVKEFGKDINVNTNPEQPKEAEKEITTAKHRVGDRVRVRYDLSVGDYGNAFCNANMVSQAGKILTIAKNLIVLDDIK